MRGHGAGSSWLPLHCVLLLGPKFQGWWWPLAEPLVGALLQAHPRAAQQRVLEGVPFPFGHLPLELAVTRGWDARVVAKAEKKTAGKGAKPPPASSAPEIALHEIKGGGTVATLAAAGWKKEDAPESIRGLRWCRKAAESCKPRIKLDVLLLLPKPDKDLGNWSDGREIRRSFEDKLSSKACKAAKHASKRAKRAENFAKKAMGKGKKIADDPNKAKAAVAELLEAAALYASIVETLVAAHEGFVVLDDSKLAAAKTERSSADTIVSQTAPLSVRAKLPLNPTAPGQLARAWYDAMHAGGHAPPEAPNAAAPPETDAPASSAKGGAEPKKDWASPSVPPLKSA
ncbi:hypothetical protein JL721_9677 [Aureococcus anophagefferens]|nr:hypothetical protein JL721_9677 [Aureococcus anophagefferens]